MNKQQLIKKLGYVRYSDTDDERYNYYNKGIDTAISFAKKINDPEKPVIPQYVAEWLEVCKENLALSLANSMDITVMRVHHQHDKTIFWLKSAKNQETFAKAWLYGYEVKKEKLYTVRLKIIYNERESYINKDTKTDEIFLDDLTGLDGKFQVNFTQKELEELNVWNNPAFEIEEVEDD